VLPATARADPIEHLGSYAALPLWDSLARSISTCTWKAELGLLDTLARALAGPAFHDVSNDIDFGFFILMIFYKKNKSNFT
jgi:hypothetical protein